MTEIKKATQYFSEESLDRSKGLTPMQIIQFLEDFRMLHSGNLNQEKSVLISMKVKPSLLKAFKSLAKQQGKKYQTYVKELMLKECARFG
jgi:predicted DNA binding CopG/RHH family protein